MVRLVVPEGNSFAAASSFLTAETTSVVGIRSAWAAVVTASCVPEPHAVRSRVAAVMRAKGAMR
jgi:hypothetical protein